MKQNVLEKTDYLVPSCKAIDVRLEGALCGSYGDPGMPGSDGRYEGEDEFDLYQNLILMRSYRFLAISAIALLGISACQQEEIAPEVNSDVTHTVTFVAGAPETKTTVDISDGKTAKFAWTAEDVGRFNLYENSTRASSTQGTLTDGVMTIKASFDGGVSSGENTYVAVLNSANDLQILYKEAYPEDADILVSKAISSFDENQSVRLQFKREVAIAKMTLKGLDAGEVVNHITVSSTAAIAGSYGVDGWSSTKVSLDIYSALAKGEPKGYSIVANASGEAVVWFTCIPQDAATLTVKVEAADGDIYTKEFSKPITLTQGNVKGFRVEMEKLVDPHKNDNGWFLVKDARFLAAGDIIRIGCASAGKVAGALSGAILSSENATYNLEKMVSVSSAEDFTLGGTEGAWTLSSLTGKLGATALKKLSVDATAANYVGTWTIDIDSDGAATIAPTTEGFGRILCNNTSNQERFTTYTSDVQSDMLLPGIYKKYGTPAETKKDQTISFDPTSYTATIGKENTYPTLTAQSSGAKTWTSSNTKVATINESTGEITLVAAGTTTISVTVAGDATYNEGKGSYVLTVENAPIVSGETWNLVTDASTLAEGDVIVIVAANADVAMSTTQNSNNRGQQAITKNTNNNTVTINDKVQQLTLGAGKTKGTFSLSTGSGFLYAVSSSDNYLRTQTSLNDNGSWTITIASNVATLKANGKNTRNWLMYNSSNKIFSCYASGQSDVQIYRMNDTRASQSISYSAETGSIDKYTSVKNIPTLDVSGVKTTVSYTSSDVTVATVSESGEIAPLKAGTTIITAIAAASAEYREAKASFVLTVTDSTPYLTATASKTSVAAAGETVTITVDTNVGSWTATSDNADFVVETPSDNTVDVVVSKNTDATERTATITVKAGTLSETITLTQKAAGAGEAVVKTYQHVFTAKPSTGNKVTLSGASWNITATNLNSYNSQNYAGVQIGTSSKNGKITLTSSSAWSYTADGVTVTKIKEVRLWLNLGGTSVTPSVTIGGKAVTSDGTKVTQNKNAVTDWTKTTKVTFTPAAGSDTGVIVIDVTSVKAGYICAIEIDAE